MIASVSSFPIVFGSVLDLIFVFHLQIFIEMEILYENIDTDYVSFLFLENITYLF